MKSFIWVFSLQHFFRKNADSGRFKAFNGYNLHSVKHLLKKQINKCINFTTLKRKRFFCLKSKKKHADKGRAGNMFNYA